MSLGYKQSYRCITFIFFKLYKQNYAIIHREASLFHLYGCWVWTIKVIAEKISQSVGACEMLSVVLYASLVLNNISYYCFLLAKFIHSLNQRQIYPETNEFKLHGISYTHTWEGQESLGFVECSRWQGKPDCKRKNFKKVISVQLLKRMSE